MVPLLRQSVYSRLAGLWLVPSTGVVFPATRLRRLATDLERLLQEVRRVAHDPKTCPLLGRRGIVGHPVWVYAAVILAAAPSSGLRLVEMGNLGYNGSEQATCRRGQFCMKHLAEAQAHDVGGMKYSCPHVPLPASRE